MKKILNIAIFLVKNWYAVWSKFLTIIGDIQIRPHIPYVIYNPDEYEYAVHGDYIRKLEHLLQPGDIVMRGYSYYLDSLFIPGEFSHSGVYVGKIEDQPTVIHAVAEGVKAIDVIDFFQCDKACILRPKVGTEKAIERAQRWIGTKYDFKFNSKDRTEFYCHEFTAACYADNINVKTYPVTLFGKQLNFISEKYLADSFLSNENFEVIVSYKPKN